MIRIRRLSPPTIKNGRVKQVNLYKKIKWCNFFQGRWWFLMTYISYVIDFSLQLQSSSWSQTPLVWPNATQLAVQAALPPRIGFFSKNLKWNKCMNDQDGKGILGRLVVTLCYGGLEMWRNHRIYYTFVCSKQWYNHHSPYYVRIEVIEVLEPMNPPLSPLKNHVLKVLQILLIIDIFFKKVFFGEGA